jgi:hypothetical protein
MGGDADVWRPCVQLSLGHAGTMYGNLLVLSFSGTEGRNPAGTAVATTRDNIVSGALSASVRPLRPVKPYIAGVPTTYRRVCFLF